jgi:hypothetical protein
MIPVSETRELENRIDGFAMARTIQRARSNATTRSGPVDNERFCPRRHVACHSGFELMKIALIVGGLLAVVAIIWYLARRPRESAVALSPSYDGPIDQYHGGKTLLVAVHAPWASVWRATAEALAKADPARYDIKLINADRDKQAVRALGVDIIPTVIVYKDGHEVARRPNMMSIDQLP